MKKLFKQLIYTVISACFMLMPAMAGQVEIQTHIPYYTVVEELTEEEQRALNATIDYFIENQNVEYVELKKEDYPSLSEEWFNNLVNNKIETFVEEYAVQCDFQNTSYIHRFDSLCCISYQHGRYYVFNKFCYDCPYADDENNVQELYDFVNYTYALVPQIGITEGMDELQAIDIINNFACDLLTYGDSPVYKIYETKQGICEHYSLLVKALCEGAGIECSWVVNDAENHAWNEIIVDGQALEIDSCWNDSHEDRHKYYLLPRSEMAKITAHENIRMRY